jgi:hypothetical protein
MYDMGDNWTRLPATDTLPPYSGTGFISNQSGQLIPEYYIEKDTVKFLEGAEIYEFTPDGVGTLIAIYQKGKWVTI